jgi:lipopolysaccharide export system permease protein
MRRLTRHILTQLIGTFLIALLAMTVVLMLAIVAQEAIRQGLGPEPIAKLIPYLLPEALRFAIPGTMLYATCMVYGRMSASGEITALRSLGISPRDCIRPTLVLALLISLAGVWLNDVAVSWGREGAHRVVLHSVEQIAYGMLRTQRSYTSSRLSINVKGVEGRKLIRPTVLFHSGPGQPDVLLTAQHAELTSNPRENTLSIFLTNGSIEVGDKARVTFPDTIERVISLHDAAQRGHRGSPSDTSLREIPAALKSYRQQIETLEQSMAVQASFHLLRGEWEHLADEDYLAMQKELAQDFQLQQSQFFSRGGENVDPRLLDLEPEENAPRPN